MHSTCLFDFNVCLWSLTLNQLVLSNIVGRKTLINWHHPSHVYSTCKVVMIMKSSVHDFNRKTVPNRDRIEIRRPISTVGSVFRFMQTDLNLHSFQPLHTSKPSARILTQIELFRPDKYRFRFQCSKFQNRRFRLVLLTRHESQNGPPIYSFYRHRINFGPAEINLDRPSVYNLFQSGIWEDPDSGGGGLKRIQIQYGTGRCRMVVCFIAVRILKRLGTTENSHSLDGLKNGVDKKWWCSNSETSFSYCCSLGKKIAYYPRNKQNKTKDRSSPFHTLHIKQLLHIYFSYS